MYFSEFKFPLHLISGYTFLFLSEIQHHIFSIFYITSTHELRPDCRYIPPLLNFFYLLGSMRTLIDCALRRGFGLFMNRGGNSACAVATLLWGLLRIRLFNTCNVGLVWMWTFHLCAGVPRSAGATCDTHISQLTNKSQPMPLSNLVRSTPYTCHCQERVKGNELARGIPRVRPPDGRKASVDLSSHEDSRRIVGGSPGGLAARLREASPGLPPTKDTRA
jgi:hypothetical protein